MKVLYLNYNYPKYLVYSFLELDHNLKYLDP